MTVEWQHRKVQRINSDWRMFARQKQKSLTKPAGSLGKLEDMAVQLSALLNDAEPNLDKIQITVFAADHGIAEEGVSAFPQAVTTEMVRNFSRGGAAISVLAQQLGADLEVVNVGTVSEHEELTGVIMQRIADGTANFSQQAAMTQEQLVVALEAGRDAVRRLRKKEAHLFIGGDMGIANTTSATAIACALLNESPETLVGPGTGLNAEGVQHKAEVIARSLALHEQTMQTPLDVLQHVGGFEIAALTGAYISCAEYGIPILVDGFIATAAALVAIKLNTDVQNWMFFAHASAEPGHQYMMRAIKAQPILDLDMHLGEGSGAAMAVPVLRLACALHNNMATFEQAGVSNKS